MSLSPFSREISYLFFSKLYSRAYLQHLVALSNLCDVRSLAQVHHNAKCLLCNIGILFYINCDVLVQVCVLLSRKVDTSRNDASAVLLPRLESSHAPNSYQSLV